MACGEVGLPAGQLLVDRLGRVQVGLVVRQVLDARRRRRRRPRRPCTVSSVSRTSSLVMASSDSELSRTAWRSITASNQPGPAAAAGVGAVLAADVDEVVAEADLLGVGAPRAACRRPRRRDGQLGRERPGADPGDVGLGDADDPVDVAGPDAGAGARAAGHRVRRGDERIGAVVEVEERGLRALEQHVLRRRSSASCTRLTVSAMCGSSRGRHSSRYWSAISSASSGSWLKTLARTWFFSFSDHVELGPEDLGVEQVLHPQADPGRLVGVGRADAPLGGAELVRAEAALGEPVDLLVVREDQVGVAADLQRGCSRRPWRASMSISASSTRGSTTTPLPMTGVMWS